MASANKRIMNELAQANNNLVEGVTVNLPDESDVHLWMITMVAPSESVYKVNPSSLSLSAQSSPANPPQGGTFKIEVSLPKDYPFKPPVLSFKTKIYHPNVSNDDKGSICLGMLRSDQWKPPNKIVDVLKLVKTILSEPQPDDAVEASIGDQYKRDYKTFEKTAKEWVAKYAK
ncbi:Ubiquitin-conjugating enzyme E2 14 [Sphaceloma murrayae]|uniref:Ubiquitin-conjugating enzyme E2 14 n=1 Tax=Sphaceloma murrayae TaxID=2082308 RepID=A0A2K1QLL8_9PEZI|nr:Ubiquitin-conjugating enzyme E2 14 [Sphaceloma murrayae]